MSHEQMMKRCPGSQFLYEAYLEDYKFIYDGFSLKREGPVANIFLNEGSVVRGGVFDISDRDLEKLDYHEGYPGSYNRSLLTIKNIMGLQHEAIVYFRTKQKEGRPSRKYLDIILRGADDCGLSEEYIKSVLWTSV